MKTWFHTHKLLGTLWLLTLAVTLLGTTQVGRAKTKVLAGLQSEWIYMMGNKVTFYPKNVETEWEFKDIHNAVRTKVVPAGANINLQDETVWGRFVPKIDVEYDVREAR